MGKTQKTEMNENKAGIVIKAQETRKTQKLKLE
jgi:hypothetical protein